MATTQTTGLQPTEWPFKVTTLTTAEIADAVKDKVWQSFRRELKGMTTESKLYHLAAYMNREPSSRVRRVRVDNYINALLRGGQLVRRSDGVIVVQR